MVITDHFPEIEPFIELNAEEAAIHLLQYIKKCIADPRTNQNKVNRNNICIEIAAAFRPERKTPHKLEVALKLKAAEAFDYLRFNLYLVGEPAQDQWYFVTRKGHEVDEIKDLEKQSLLRLFKDGSLHSEVVEAAFEPFLRRDYEYAVFSSLKKLEVKVREVCDLEPKCIGVDLMRKAFAAGGALFDP